jgi:hypothetical protein
VHSPARTGTGEFRGLINCHGYAKRQQVALDSSARSNFKQLGVLPTKEIHQKERQSKTLSIFTLIQNHKEDFWIEAQG